MSTPSLEINSKVHNNLLISNYLDEKMPIGFPPGIIMIWNEKSNIPDGWAECNGQGTLSNGIAIPDLRDTLLRMATTQDSNDNDFQPGEKNNTSIEVTKGRIDKHDNMVKVSNATNEVVLQDKHFPDHKHTFEYDYRYIGKTFNTGQGGRRWNQGDKPSFPSENRTGNLSRNGNEVKFNSFGNTNQIKMTSLPPCKALTYIIKL